MYTYGKNLKATLKLVGVVQVGKLEGGRSRW